MIHFSRAGGYRFKKSIAFMWNSNLSTASSLNCSIKKYIATMMPVLLTDRDGRVVRLCLNNLMMVFTLLFFVSCQSQGGNRSEVLGNSADDANPYPVPPKVHAELPSTNPLDPKTFPRSIPNAQAYARYALGLLSQKSETFSADSDQLLLEDLRTIVQSTKVSPQVVAPLLALGVSSAELKASADQIRAIYRTAELEGSLVTKSLVLGKQLNQCMKDSGVDLKHCCDAFLIPQLLFEEGKIPDFYSSAKSAREIDFSAMAALNQDSAGSIFRLQGTKVWLSQCSTAAIGLPRKLSDFKRVFGDYHTWPSELHPISMAKQKGRRIYRNNKAKVSVAETLTEACDVAETEFIVEGKDSNLAFGVFNERGQISPLSSFPKGSGGEILRFSPDICMACHLKLDTRRFNVRIPSREALRLHLFSSGSNALYRNDIGCAREGERVVWDEKPKEP